MLILGTALALAVIAIASFPCWPYSRRFGYAPSASAAVLLMIVALLAVGHRSDILVVAGPTMASTPVTD